MDFRFPGESAEYRAVAAARRELPPGGEVPEDFDLTPKGDPIGTSN